MSNSEIENIYNSKFKHLVEAEDLQSIDTAKSHKTIHSLSNNQTDNPDDIWIFGYGSLIWKVDFPYTDWKRGYIKGYLRRFFQNSIDHRGVKVKPGRVVTLVHTGNVEDRVYGVAYRVAAADKEEVIKHLDFREKNGYQRCTVPFHVFPGSTTQKGFNILIYIATPENESWAGSIDENIDQIAEQIFTSAGPSGRNRDYLFNLCSAMRNLFPGVHDDHLAQLESAVRTRIKKDEIRLLETALKSELERIQQKLYKGFDCYNEVEHLLHFCSEIGWREYFLSKELYGIHSQSLWSDDDR